MPPTDRSPDASSFARRHAAWRLLATAALCLGLAACGGSGSDSSAGTGGSGVDQLAVVKVSVSDAFGAPIAGAAVQASAKSWQTDATGAALVVIETADRRDTLTVSRDTFVGKSVQAAGTPGQVTQLSVVLDRVTAPAGASLGTRSGTQPMLAGSGRELSFEIELVLVDGSGAPLQGLTSADFALRPCTPDAANDRVDCLRGSTADDDKPYAPLTAAPASVVPVPGGPALPYAAALLLDQSGSIAQTDPTGARLYSAKAFLGRLGTDDRALLAAFAGAGATLPSVPLTVYGPFRDSSTEGGYFSTLDGLNALVGGNTPLYQSLDALRQQVVADATLPSGLTKAVVLFTDGSDTACGGVAACATRRTQSVQAAVADHVRVFTIGLSSGVDVAALGELSTQTGGAFLYADSAEQLLPLYGSLGKLLSLSLPTYRLRWTVQADAAGVFRSGQTLLGKVRVSSATGSFDVPFLVGIP